MRPLERSNRPSRCANSRCSRHARRSVDSLSEQYAAAWRSVNQRGTITTLVVLVAVVVPIHD